MPTMSTGPSFQRRTKPSAGEGMRSTSGNAAAGGKAKQYDGRSMAKQYMQRDQKSSSARITANVWGTGEVKAKG